MKLRHPRTEAALLTLLGLGVAYLATTSILPWWGARHFEERLIAWLVTVPAGLLVGVVVVFLAMLALDWDRQRFEVRQTRRKVENTLMAVAERRRRRRAEGDGDPGEA